jgi:hypothetical protein
MEITHDDGVITQIRDDNASRIDESARKWVFQLLIALFIRQMRAKCAQIRQLG